MKVAQSCPTLCNEILQARILEWVAILFSRESSQATDWTQVSCIVGGFFTSWATREAQLGESMYYNVKCAEEGNNYIFMEKRLQEIEMLSVNKVGWTDVAWCSLLWWTTDLPRSIASAGELSALVLRQRPCIPDFFREKNTHLQFP